MMNVFIRFTSFLTLIYYVVCYDIWHNVIVS